MRAVTKGGPQGGRNLSFALTLPGIATISLLTCLICLAVVITTSEEARMEAESEYARQFRSAASRRAIAVVSRYQYLVNTVVVGAKGREGEFPKWLNMGVISMGKLLLTLSPASSTLGFIPCVPHAEREDFEAEMSEAFGRPMRITAVGGVVAPNATEYAPIMSTQIPGYTFFRGQDLLQNPQRRAAMYRSRARNAVSLVDPVIPNSFHISPTLITVAPLYRANGHFDATNSIPPGYNETEDGVPLVLRQPAPAPHTGTPNATTFWGWVVSAFNGPTVASEVAFVTEVVDGFSVIVESYDVDHNGGTLTKEAQRFDDLFDGDADVASLLLHPEAKEHDLPFGDGKTIIAVEDVEGPGGESVVERENAVGKKVYFRFLSKEVSDKKIKNAAKTVSTPTPRVHKFASRMGGKVWSVAIVAEDAYFNERLERPQDVGYAVGVPISFVAAVIVGVGLMLIRAEVNRAEAEERAEKERREAHEAAVNYAAHELRNPLQAIVAGVSFMHETVNKKQKVLRRRQEEARGSEKDVLSGLHQDLSSLTRDIVDVESAALRISRIIADLADARTVGLVDDESNTAAMMAWAVEPDILHPILSTALSSIRLWASNGTFVPISLSVSGNIPHVGVTDALRLSQVIGRLLEVSFRFSTPTSFIHVCITTKTSNVPRPSGWDSDWVESGRRLVVPHPPHSRKESSSLIDGLIHKEGRRGELLESRIVIEIVDSGTPLSDTPTETWRLPFGWARIPWLDAESGADEEGASDGGVEVTGRDIGILMEAPEEEEEEEEGGDEEEGGAVEEGRGVGVTRDSYKVSEEGRASRSDRSRKLLSTTLNVRRVSSALDLSIAQRWAKALGGSVAVETMKTPIGNDVVVSRMEFPVAPLSMASLPISDTDLVTLAEEAYDIATVEAEKESSLAASTREQDALARVFIPSTIPHHPVIPIGSGSGSAMKASRQSGEISSTPSLAASERPFFDTSSRTSGESGTFNSNATPDVVPVPGLTFTTGAAPLQQRILRGWKLKASHSAEDEDSEEETEGRDSESRGIEEDNIAHLIGDELEADATHSDAYAGTTAEKHDDGGEGNGEDGGGEGDGDGEGRGAAAGVVVVPEKEKVAKKSRRRRGRARRIQSDGDAAPKLLVGKTVLVVDDEAMVRTLMKRMVEGLGAAHVIALSDGSEVAPWFAIHKEKPADLILMDIVMRSMNGDECARLLREGGWEMPIIAITSNHASWSEDAFLASGFTTILPKPVTPPILRKTIAEVLDATT